MPVIIFRWLATVGLLILAAAILLAVVDHVARAWRRRRPRR